MPQTALKPYEPVTLRQPHPLILGAAAAVLVFSVLGSAAIVSWIPAGQNTTPAVTGNTPLTTAQEAISVACLNCGSVSAIHAVRIEKDAAPLNMPGNVGNDQRMTYTVGEPAALPSHSKSAQRIVDIVTVYRVTVRMDDGSYRTLSQADAPAVAVGDKVRVVKGSLIHNRI